MGNLNNRPRLRFPEFLGKCELKKFDDIFTFSTGKNIKQSEASPEFEIPCVRYGELYHMYNEVITKVINKTNLDKSELLFSQGNEILLPSAGEDPLDIGSASALTIENVAIGRTINILKPLRTNIYSNIYVSYFINHKLKKDISKLAKGVSISNVYNSDLKTLKINLPSLPEQTKIANFLTAVDDKLSQLKKKKSLLEEYKKGIMQKIFSQELRFKDENGEEFAEWKEKKLGEIFYSEKGKGISKNRIVENGKYECVLYGELYTKYKEVIFKVVSRTNEEDGIKSIKGDLLIPSSTTTTGIDLANITALNKDNVLLGGDITVLRSYEKINNIFYAYYLTNHKKDEIASYAQGSTIVHLYYSHIKDLYIDLPSYPEQTKIANFLSAIDNKIRGVAEQVEAMEGWKKGLLQRMFV